MVVLFPIVFAGHCLCRFIANGQRTIWLAFVLFDRLPDFAVADQMVECPNRICLPPSRGRGKRLAGPDVAALAGRAVCLLLYRRAIDNRGRCPFRHYIVWKMGGRKSSRETFCL